MLSQELLPSQKKFIDNIAHKVIRLNIYQMSKFFKLLNDQTMKINPLAPLSYEPAWPKGEDYTQYPSEPSFKNQEDIMKEISEWYKKNLPEFGLGSSSGPAITNTVEKKEETKSDVVKEV